MKTETADVIIIGGGIQGCATAWNLAKDGVSCIVLEKDHVARHASGVNAGGVRRLGRHLAEVPLSRRASEIWPQLDEWLEADTGFHASRQIKVAESEADIATLKKRVASVQALGFEHEELIDQQQLRSLLPAISPHCLGGIVVEGDGSAIPYKATSAFARAATAQGARIVEDCTVTGITRDGDSWKVSTAQQSFAGRVIVNCAGAWGHKIAELLGDNIPLQPQAPMLLITQRMPIFMEGVVGATSRPLSFKQFENGTVLVGGGYRGQAYPDRNYASVNTTELAKCANNARTIFPLMNQARINRSWAGIEGVTPDQIPVLGAGSKPNTFHAFGFSAHGFQMGPVTGETLARLIQGKPLSYSIEPFRYDRFDTGVSSEFSSHPLL
ncbi:NAD(P)/FAD-dependent oxidoreductase [Marinobacterium lutimaris]|uniref:Sarcosine oxidase subunit beta n=1 Tax=Marinobacterium lutimaris TaxID=568106 RepID=A0A1H5TPY3_9GAMM|nr:FAD-dependent oxidoreductase [Marinobacterium lutimaris]SEF64839.1 sarcosine oxidase subunit beta [Marinobacterium lutimaris]